MNSKHQATGRALPIVLATPSDATLPASGELSDREAPADALKYRVAQADWFGRWSQWGGRTVPEKARPLPPIPVIEATYTQATFGAPVPDGPLFGQLTLRARVPRVEDLAPGSRLLVSLRIRAVIDGTAVIALRGEAASYQILNGQAEKDSSMGCDGALPARSLADFEVRKTKGRGTIKILEAPNAANSFTGKVQIDDPARGADRYVLVIRWKL